MSSSASEAAKSEKKIREKLIKTGCVEAIVSVGNNFFYTRSLPCHLWFFNKSKKNKNHILMIDARKIFRKVTQTINDFSEEQLSGLTTIMNNFRGEKADFNGSKWLREKFPNGKYEDIESFCKIASMEDVKENDYSLTPGRYVGYSIQFDKEFDYKKKITEIRNELNELDKESNELTKKIKFKIYD